MITVVCNSRAKHRWRQKYIYDKNLKKCLENSQFTRFGGQRIMSTLTSLLSFVLQNIYKVSMTNMGFEIYFR